MEKLYRYVILCCIGTMFAIHIIGLVGNSEDTQIMKREGKMIKRLYGLNVAVKDLASATQKYEKLLNIKSKHMNGSVFDVDGVAIHLIASLTNDTSVAKFLEKKGDGVFLITLEVSDIENEMERMKKEGAIFVSDKVFTGGFGKVNFIHPKSVNGIQIEILEPSKK